MRDFSEKIKQSIGPIANDNRSGSSELSKRAAVALLDLLDDMDESDSSPVSSLISPLLQFAKQLLKAQPQMATLFNLVNKALLISSTQETFGKGKASVEKFVYSYLAAVVSGSENITQQILPLFSGKPVVLLHSYSGTVAKVLISAKQQGISFEVLCTESRPVMEGRRTASVLSAAGIPVTFIVDAAIWLAMNKVTIAIVGADAITMDGIINKIGTTLITFAARETARPVYVMADTTKFLPASYSLPIEGMHPSTEIWPDVPEKISISNHYFEQTSLDSFNGLITEQGLLGIPEVKTHLTGLGVYSELCAEL
jgi:translation initiation factor eIF-2B subunit delta